MDFEFKKDKYKIARGTYSRLLNLHCRVCGNILAIYQKDGPGDLRRLYMDRILYPKKLTNLEKKDLNEAYDSNWIASGKFINKFELDKKYSF